MLWRIPVAAVLSAVLMMLWGFVFWVQLPYAKEISPQAADEAALTEALAANLPETGTYFVPSPYRFDPNNAEEKAAFAQRHQTGPLVHIFYHQGGMQMEDPRTYARGMAHYFLTALLASILVAYTARKRSFLGRVFVSLLVVMFAIVWMLPANVIWFYHPVDYCALLIGYNFVGGLLMSLVVGLLVKRKTVDD